MPMSLWVLIAASEQLLKAHRNMPSRFSDHAQVQLRLHSSMLRPRTLILAQQHSSMMDCNRSDLRNRLSKLAQLAFGLS